MGKKRAQLKSAGEESNKNVDVVPVRAIQPCGEVTLIGEGGGCWVISFTSPVALGRFHPFTGHEGP